MVHDIQYSFWFFYDDIIGDYELCKVKDLYIFLLLYSRVSIRISFRIFLLEITFFGTFNRPAIFQKLKISLIRFQRGFFSIFSGF